jgi:hypothetical protein
MSRERVFISYSHQDRSWLDRLMEHLAALERWGLVHTWSDNRIAAGSDWQSEIEEALSRSRVAVLLVSPPFLASQFVWKEEMPRIVAHEKNGMLVLPLVVRPCAWRLEKDLETLQARPLDGHALALGSDAQIDLDLMNFVYELAALVGKISADLVTEEWERAARAPLSDRSSTSSTTVAPPNGRGWSGRYNGSFDMTLFINQWPAARFQGTMFYPESGTVTWIEGTSLPAGAAPPADLALSSGGVAVAFRETGYKQQGSRTIDFDGEYRAVVADDAVTGAWMKGERLVGSFRLEPIDLAGLSQSALQRYRAGH